MIKNFKHSFYIQLLHSLSKYKF